MHSIPCSQRFFPSHLSSREKPALSVKRTIRSGTHKHFQTSPSEFFLELTNYITYDEGKLSGVFEIASRMINSSVRNSIPAA